MKEEQKEEEKKKKVEQKMAQIEVKNEVRLHSHSARAAPGGSDGSDVSALVLPAAPGGGEGQEKSSCQASGGTRAEEEVGRRG